MSEYTPIEPIKIGRGGDTDKLYKLEEKTENALKESAQELHEFLIAEGHSTPERFYQDALPQAMAVLLEHFGGHNCVICTTKD